MLDIDILKQLQAMASERGINIEPLLQKWLSEDQEQTLVRLQSLVETQSAFIVRTDLNGYYTYCNPPFIDKYRWLGENLIGIHSLQTILPEDHANVIEVVNKCLQSPSQSVQITLRKPLQDGAFFWSIWEFVALQNHLGEVTEIQCIGFDIDQQKRAEEALRLSEENFRIVANWTYDWEYWMDVDGTFRYISPSVERVTGYSVENFMADASLMSSLIHPDDQLLWLAHHQTHKLKESSDHIGDLEFRIINRDGKIHWIHHVCRPVFGDQHRFLGRRVSNRDITIRKHAEEALADSEARYRQMFENNSAIKLLIDPITGDIVDANTAAEVFYGYTRKQLQTMKIQQINTLSEAEVFAEMQLAREEKRRQFNFRHRLASGAIRDVEVFSGPVILKEHAYLYSIVMDVTQRNAAEAEVLHLNQVLEQQVAERTAELQLAQKQNETILNHVADAILLTDAQGQILYVNPAWERLTGYTLDEVFQKNPRLLQSSLTLPETYRAMWANLKEGKAWQGHLTNKHKVGRLYEVLLTVVPVKNQEGRIQYFVGVQHDVTEARRLENMKEQFVADAAHDLRNPLATLNLRLFSLKRNPQRLDEHVAVMENQIQRLTTLVEDLLTLSRLDRRAEDLKLSPLDLNQLIGDLVVSYRPLAAVKQQTLTFLPASELASIQADMVQVERIVVNLLSNAINYTPEQGTITLQTRQLPEGVCFSVQDTGIGIAPADLDRIFDRFYRADVVRNTINGTGLGLPIVKQLVELHRGTLQVESEEGVGSTFTVTLPTNLSP